MATAMSTATTHRSAATAMWLSETSTATTVWLAEASARLPVTRRNITLLRWSYNRALLRLVHLWLMLLAHLRLVHLWLWLLMRLPKATIALWFAHLRLIMIAKTICLMWCSAVWRTVLLAERAAAYPVHGSSMRPAMVCRGKLASVMASHGLVRYLLMRRCNMSFVHGNPFLRARIGMYTTRAVKAGAVVRYITYYRTINIRIVYYGAVYINHRRVVAEVTAKPGSAYKTYAYVAKAIVNTAVITNVRPPVTRVKAVKTVVETPVAGRP